MLLQVQNIQKKIKNRFILKDISLSFQTKQIVGILGPNGSGKTTAFGSILGLFSIDKGRIMLDDKDISRMSTPKRIQAGIGYLQQEISLFLDLSIEKNMLIVAEYLSLNTKEMHRIVSTLLEYFGLLKLKHQLASSLSGGEKRRLEIARCLLTDPKFLLLDEPFVGIDPITIISIQEIILELKNSKNKGIIITDHNVKSILDIADIIYVVYNGCIFFHGTGTEFLKNQEIKKFYLGDDLKNAKQYD